MAPEVILAYYPLMRVYLLAAYLAAPMILQAQTIDPRLIPILAGSVGREARIHVDSGISTITGAIQRVRGDTLFLSSIAGTSQALAVPRITHLDIRETLTADARLRRTRVAGVAGALIGAVIGYEIAIPQVRRAQRQGNWYAVNDYWFDPLAGGLLGLAIGAASGNAWRDHWVT